MVTIAMNLATLPEKLTLQPVRPVPLPQNYRFTVGWGPGWHPPRRDDIVLFIENIFVPCKLPAQEEPGTFGFCKVLEAILYHAHSHNLWGQTLQCTAVSMAANGTTFETRSNAQPLHLPVKPLADIGPQQWPWNPIVNDTPAPLSLPFQSGRRLYRREPVGSGAFGMPKLWYVKPDNTLEDSNTERGFDRMTFWQAVFGMSIKQTRNLKFEDAMAKLLNAHVVSGVPASAKLADLVAAVGGSPGALGRCLLWTSTRFVCMLHKGPNTLWAMEFDALGFHEGWVNNWIATEDQSVVWNYRRLNWPTPPPSSGPLSLG